MMSFAAIHDPRGIFATHEHSAKLCPICSGLLDFQHGEALEVERALAAERSSLDYIVALWTADEANALPRRGFGGPDDTNPPLPNDEVGFEVVEVPVKDDADASGKIRKIEAAKGVQW